MGKNWRVEQIIQPKPLMERKESNRKRCCPLRRIQNGDYRFHEDMEPSGCVSLANGAQRVGRAKKILVVPRCIEFSRGIMMSMVCMFLKKITIHTVGSVR